MIVDVIKLLRAPLLAASAALLILSYVFVYYDYMQTVTGNGLVSVSGR